MRTLSNFIYTTCSVHMTNSYLAHMWLAQMLYYILLLRWNTNDKKGHEKIKRYCNYRSYYLNSQNVNIHIYKGIVNVLSVLPPRSMCFNHCFVLCFQYFLININDKLNVYIRYKESYHCTTWCHLHRLKVLWITHKLASHHLSATNINWVKQHLNRISIFCSD